jgi:hypothetical protein
MAQPADMVRLYKPNDRHVVSLCLLMATSMAYLATTWPKVQFPEMSALVGDSLTISGQVVGTISSALMAFT